MDGMLKKMNKTTKNNLITYAMVILAFVIMQILISAGSISSLLQGLMVPLCTYIILAVSLNLVVGILGELSLGHAGFMCVGAFTSAFFSKCTRDVIASDGLRFFLALLIGIVTAAIFGMLIGIPDLSSYIISLCPQCSSACYGLYWGYDSELSFIARSFPPVCTMLCRSSGEDAGRSYLI